MTDQPVPGRSASGHKPQSRQHNFSWKLWTAGGASLALMLVVVFLLGAVPASPTDEVAPGINAPTAELLQLDMLTGMNVTAPPFALTDQHGKPMTLAQFKGRSVVLTFNDDRCQDLCTLLAQDVLAANRDLGAAATSVVFVSINANPYYPGIGAVKSWTDDHGLGGTGNWVFGTGSPSQLAATSSDYGVPVEVDPATQDVTHGAEIFFIDPAGHEAAVGQFGTESANTELFAHAMAQMAVDVLPDSHRPTVGGPSATGPAAGGTELGATPAPIVLPKLGADPSTATSTTSPGRYQVVNFWSSTCTACVREMPDLQKEANALNGAVSFVGVDVADQTGAAAAAARSAGSTYPLVADPDGTTAGRFTISGLPSTVILSPTGKVLLRHPGIFTADQLDYLLRSLDPALARD
jgi:cytochrome oxidase Cu insertion factor (SCO1/SenC/PrrC family)/thiol-disulfide isomerase/thioredoxin